MNDVAEWLATDYQACDRLRNCLVLSKPAYSDPEPVTTELLMKVFFQVTRDGGHIHAIIHL